MLKIALCDDDKEQVSILTDKLREYYGTDVNLSVFGSASALLEHAQWSGKDVFDLYILDVIMPGMTGIELGKELRELEVTAPIIYLTCSTEYAVDSYNVRAFHYLVKPVDKDQLFSVLRMAEEYIARSKSDSIAVNTPDGTEVIRISEILYAELYERSARYHLITGENIVSQKLRISFQKAVSELLERNNFIMLGSSFLVNLHYIKKVGKKELLLADKRSLPIPKGTRNVLMSKWMDYWMSD